MGSPSMADLREAKKEVWNRLFSRAVYAHSNVKGRRSIKHCTDTPLNIVGVSIGYKQADGLDSPIRCVRVLVRKKIPKSKLPRSTKVLLKYDGIESDVEEVGNIRFAANSCAIPASRQPRPSACGVSVSGGDLSSGSLGYVIRKKGSSKRYLLSNYHVFYPLQDSTTNLDIYQPGSTDEAVHLNNRIGTAVDGTPIRLCSDGSILTNRMDAAIAEVIPNTVRSELCTVGKLQKGISTLKLSTNVWMFGKSSRSVWGVVNNVNLDAIIPIGSTCAVFSNQVYIAPISQRRFGKKGDSGSIVINNDRYACGLFFAIDGKGGGYATSISRVLKKFNAVID